LLPEQIKVSSLGQETFSNVKCFSVQKVYLLPQSVCANDAKVKRQAACKKMQLDWRMVSVNRLLFAFISEFFAFY
jgi:hypothetical protein